MLPSSFFGRPHHAFPPPPPPPCTDVPPPFRSGPPPPVPLYFGVVSQIGADVDGLKSVSDVANYLALSASDRITPLAAQLSNLTSVVSAFPSRLSKGTVYYYNWFSTYTSQRSNPPWISTDSFLVRSGACLLTLAEHAP